MKLREKLDIKVLSKIARNWLMKDLFQALEIEYETTADDIDDLHRNVFIFEADEKTIQKWESFMELEVRKDFTLRDRAERIVYTLQSRGIFTDEFLKEQAKIFTGGGEIEITENFVGYSFTIEFTNIVGLPKNMENFTKMIELNKPAHLTYSFKFRYNTYGQVAFKKNGELRGKTYLEVYNSRLYEDADVKGRFHTYRETSKFMYGDLKTKTYRQIFNERR